MFLCLCPLVVENFITFYFITVKWIFKFTKETFFLKSVSVSGSAARQCRVESHDWSYFLDRFDCCSGYGHLKSEFLERLLFCVGQTLLQKYLVLHLETVLMLDCVKHPTNIRVTSVRVWDRGWKRGPGLCLGVQDLSSKKDFHILFLCVSRVYKLHWRENCGKQSSVCSVLSTCHVYRPVSSHTYRKSQLR